jgi:hypothetical protein
VEGSTADQAVEAFLMQKEMNGVVAWHAGLLKGKKSAEVR